MREIIYLCYQKDGNEEIPYLFFYRNHVGGSIERFRAENAANISETYVERNSGRYA